MKTSHRVGFYFGGFAIGIVFLIFFLSGKKTSCHYFPNARVLSDIQSKSKTYSPSSLEFFNSKELDTAKINTYLDDSNIDFSKSQTDREPCPVYQIESKAEAGKFHFVIKNCVDFAKVQKAEFSETE